MRAVAATAIPACVGLLAGAAAPVEADAAAPAEAAARARPAAACAGAELVPSPADLAAVDAATLCLVDLIRTAHRLRPVRANSQLAGAAASKLAEMVRWNYFADVGPLGRTPTSLIASSRYRARAAAVAVGQNIAWGSGAQSTPASIVAAWMASPPHRAVLLRRRFRDAGVAASTTLPPVLGPVRGATYALELAGR